MPIAENDKGVPGEPLDLSIQDDMPDGGGEQDADTPHPSEVAMRINLLGKLIIPRSAP